MELRHLKYFAAIVRAGSFSKAADVLGIAQPALSRRIKDLEDQLGFPLFERLPNGVRPSPQGELFLTQAQQILSAVDRALARAGDIAKGQAGTLNLGMVNPAPDLPVVAEALSAFKAAFKDVVVNIRTVASEIQLELIRDGQLDIGCLYYRPVGAPDFAFAEIQVSNFVVAMSQTHQLAGRKQVVLADLQGESFVALPRSTSVNYFNQLHSICEERSFHPQIIQEVPTENLQLALIASSNWVGFINSTILNRPRRNGIVFKEIADLSADMEIDFLWRVDNRSPVLMNFLAVMNPILARDRASRVKAPAVAQFLDRKSKMVKLV